VDKPIVGVQWHPEMMRIQEPIWDWFVKACS
jgi:gamma-glutamyl-gamma-aminobutyrate hydrolase PuuD